MTKTVEPRTRIPPAEDIRAEFSAGAARGFGRLLDISAGGLFVRSALLPPRGPVYMVLRTPTGREIRVAGEVCWNTAGKRFRASGFGVRLTGPGRDYNALLTRARELHNI
jgi:PilZ domain-containing protein